MSKSTYRAQRQTQKRGPSALVRVTSIVLALLVIASIVASLVRQY